MATLQKISLMILGLLAFGSAASAEGARLRFRQEPSSFNYANVPFEQAPVLQLERPAGVPGPVGTECVVRLRLEANSPVRLLGTRTRRTRGEVADFTGARLRVSGVSEQGAYRLVAEGRGGGVCEGLSAFSDYFVVSPAN